MGEGLPVNWRRLGQYHMQTPEGYRVTRANVSGEARYTAWVPERWQAWSHKPIGVYKRAGNAKRACERHLEQSVASLEAA